MGCTAWPGEREREKRDCIELMCIVKLGIVPFRPGSVRSVVIGVREGLFFGLDAFTFSVRVDLDLPKLLAVSDSDNHSHI